MKHDRKFGRLFEPAPRLMVANRIRIIPGQKEDDSRGEVRIDRLEADGDRLEGHIRTTWSYGKVRIHTVYREATTEGQKINWLLAKNGYAAHPDYRA